MKYLILVLIGLIYSSASICQRQVDDRESAHFVITNNAKQFSLTSTNVDVSIAGPVADVTVTQVYQNQGNDPIEAIYVFPSSTKAALYSMEIKIGTRIIKAEVKEKQQARQEYNQAKEEGKLTSLLEQHNPNVFQMNVANILPGDVVYVEMKYNELLIPEDGKYTFVYPTVVGPRYSNGINKHSVFTNPHETMLTAPLHTFDIRLHINSPVCISEALCQSHNVMVDYKNKNEAEAKLASTDKVAGNRDFIFTYKLSDDVIMSGTMLYEHSDENFFLSIIEPPTKVRRDEVVPREYVFIVDVSGSMIGFPLNTSKMLMENLLDGVRKDDYFNILLFASSSRVLSTGSLPATSENIKRGLDFVSNASGGGGTELLTAVKKAMAIPKPFTEHSRSMVILTDGYVHVERETFNYIEDNLGTSNFFAFGIGSSVNRYLIEGIAKMGRAESFVVTSSEFAKTEAEKFKKYISAPLLTDIKVEFQGMDVYHVTPKRIPDLMAQRPIYIFGKYKGEPKGKMIVSGDQGGCEYEHVVNFNSIMPSSDHAGIRYMWARDKIKYLGDYYELDKNGSEKKEITALGLKYNLLTAFTSFLAIDHTPRRDPKSTTVRTVQQPKVQPYGMSQQGMGFEMGAESITEVDAESDQPFLYVHMIEVDEYKDEIEKLLQEKFYTTDQEFKDLLDGNTLSITNINGVVTCADEDKKLSAEQLEQIALHVSEMISWLKINASIKIQLLWL